MRRLFVQFMRLRGALTGMVACLACVPVLGAGVPAPTGDAAFELNIFHLNDHHSSLRPTAEVLQIDGIPTRVEMGGFARLTTLIRQTERTTPNLLKLHAGDALVGTAYDAYFGGQADAQAMNAICFDAFVPGNHDFDAGDGRLRDFLDALAADASCATAVVSANVRPEAGTPLLPHSGKPYLQPYSIRQVAGRRIGIVGLTIAGKTRQTSMPLPTTVFDDEASSAQSAIDALRQQGVRYIILLTHVGYQMDLELARKLDGVNVIIGGDSHSLLGEFASVGLSETEGRYPTVVTGRSGDPVCIGQAWAYAKVFALMQIGFDAQGRVVSCRGRASVVLGESFARADAQHHWAPLSQAQARDLRGVIDADPALRVASDDPAYRNRMASFDARYDEQASRVIARLPVDQSLCMVRVPGTVNQGGAICADVVRSSRGGDAAQLVAEAYRSALKQTQADVGLVNAGGVRSAIETDGLGDLAITNEAVFKVQPYPNELVLVRLTGRELRSSIEEGIENWLDLKRSDGSHPYASGLRWSLDLTRPNGQRVSDLEIKDQFLQIWKPLEPDRIYTLVTTAYLARGFENYRTIGAICAGSGSQRCSGFDGNLAEQSVADYLALMAARSGADLLVRRPPCSDYSHQQVVTTDGRRLEPCAVTPAQ